MWTKAGYFYTSIVLLTNKNNLKTIDQYQWDVTRCNYITQTMPPTPPFGGRNFWQIEGDGASRFTAFFTDMAMVTCFVWRATRHAGDGNLGGLERLPKRVLRLGCGSRTSLSLPYDLGERGRRFHTAPVRLGWSIFHSGSFVSWFWGVVTTAGVGGGRV